jgi:hypothetical protein
MINTYAQWSKNMPNGYEIYQYFPLQGPPKNTKFFLYHLATLIVNRIFNVVTFDDDV